MNRAAVRRLFLLIIALCGLSAGLALTSTSGAVQSPVPAWCFDRESWRWLGYLEGIPGSSSPEDFTDCLSAAAERGEIRTLRGELLDSGLLLDAGSSSIVWPVRDSEFYITAYEDRIVVKGTCDREIEVRDGQTSIIANGYPCVGAGRIVEDDQSVIRADFTIYFPPRSFVIDGEDNWLHIGYTPKSLGDGYPNRWGEITLVGRYPGLWLRHAVTIRAPTGGYGRSFYYPLAGTGSEVERHRFHDWYDTVHYELVWLHPEVRELEDAGSDLLPDYQAYGAAAQSWIDAVVDDLFAGRAPPVTLLMPRYSTDRPHNPGRSMWIEFPGTTRILLGLAQLLVHPAPGHGERAAATFLMLVDRYAPEFDAELARELAGQYQVPVGDPLDVEPVSERTSMVLDLLSQPAPQLPSDYQQIPPEQSLGTFELVVGQTYQSGSPVELLREPKCYVTARYTDGTLTTTSYGYNGKFMIGAGTHWNGLRVQEASGRETRVIYLYGEPTAPGRVRVEVTTRCIDDAYHPLPQRLGYAEIIVVGSGEG